MQGPISTGQLLLRRSAAFLSRSGRGPNFFMSASHFTLQARRSPNSFLAGQRSINLGQAAHWTGEQQAGRAAMHWAGEQQFWLSLTREWLTGITSGIVGDAQKSEKGHLCRGLLN
ncbi:hypothetical protein Droror1_Dr00000168 [Drosera rotundifolia]